MNKPNELLEQLKTIVYDLKDTCVSHVLSQPQFAVFSNNISACVRRFAASVSEINKKAFVDNNACILFKVHDIMVGQFSKTYLYKQQRAVLRSPHDMFFKSLEIKSPGARFSRLPTNIFNEFTKGITYFETDHVPGNPIYHREESCGDANVPSNQKFVERITNSSLDRKRKHVTIRRCYIERLIYDVIYSNTFYKQDIQHLHELKSVEQLHDSYYKDESVSIKIKFRDDIYPERLSIITEYPSRIETNTYAKQWGSANVSCKKTVFFTKKEIAFESYDKTQTYEREEAWLLSKND